MSVNPIYTPAKKQWRYSLDGSTGVVTEVNPPAKESVQFAFGEVPLGKPRAVTTGDPADIRVDTEGDKEVGYEHHGRTSDSSHGILPDSGILGQVARQAASDSLYSGDMVRYLVPSTLNSQRGQSPTAEGRGPAKIRAWHVIASPSGHVTVHTTGSAAPAEPGDPGFWKLKNRLGDQAHLDAHEDAVKAGRVFATFNPREPDSRMSLRFDLEKPPFKPSRESAFGYVAMPKGAIEATFAQCASCTQFTGSRCLSFGPDDKVVPMGACNWYIYGQTCSETDVTDDCFAGGKPKDAGYVEADVRCANCSSFNPKKSRPHCELYEHLNKHLPDYYDLEESVRGSSCCNSWTGHTEGRMSLGTTRLAVTDVNVAPGVYLFRHGKTKLNTDGESPDLIRGWIDVPLDDRGKEQAESLSPLGEEFDIRKVISSDLQRTQATANAIAEGAGLPVEATTALRPWNLGQFQGKNAKEAAPQLEKYATELPTEKVPGGESFEDYCNRYLPFLRQVMDAHEKDGQNIAVVTHYRNCKLTEGWVADGCKHTIDGDTFFTDDLDTAAILRLFRKGGEWQIERVNNPLDMSVRVRFANEEEVPWHEVRELPEGKGHAVHREGREDPVATFTEGETEKLAKTHALMKNKGRTQKGEVFPRPGEVAPKPSRRVKKLADNPTQLQKTIAENPQAVEEQIREVAAHSPTVAKAVEAVEKHGGNLPESAREHVEPAKQILQEALTTGNVPEEPAQKEEAKESEGQVAEPARQPRQPRTPRISKARAAGVGVVIDPTNGAGHEGLSGEDIIGEPAEPPPEQPKPEPKPQAEPKPQPAATQTKQQFQEVPAGTHEVGQRIHFEDPHSQSPMTGQISNVDEEKGTITVDTDDGGTVTLPTNHPVRPEAKEKVSREFKTFQPGHWVEFEHPGKKGEIIRGQVVGTHKDKARKGVPGQAYVVVNVNGKRLRVPAEHRGYDSTPPAGEKGGAAGRPPTQDMLPGIKGRAVETPPGPKGQGTFHFPYEGPPEDLEAGPDTPSTKKSLEDMQKEEDEKERREAILDHVAKLVDRPRLDDDDKEGLARALGLPAGAKITGIIHSESSDGEKYPLGVGVERGGKKYIYNLHGDHAHKLTEIMGQGDQHRVIEPGEAEPGKAVEPTAVPKEHLEKAKRAMGRAEENATRVIKEAHGKADETVKKDAEVAQKKGEEWLKKQAKEFGWGHVLKIAGLVIGSYVALRSLRRHPAGMGLILALAGLYFWSKHQAKTNGAGEPSAGSEGLDEALAGAKKLVKEMNKGGDPEPTWSWDSPDEGTPAAEMPEEKVGAEEKPYDELETEPVELPKEVSTPHEGDPGELLEEAKPADELKEAKEESRKTLDEGQPRKSVDQLTPDDVKKELNDLESGEKPHPSLYRRHALLKVLDGIDLNDMPDTAAKKVADKAIAAGFAPDRVQELASIARDYSGRHGTNRMMQWRRENGGQIDKVALLKQHAKRNQDAVSDASHAMHGGDLRHYLNDYLGREGQSLGDRDAHGIADGGAKGLDQLLNLLDNGVDQDRPFHTINLHSAGKGQMADRVGDPSSFVLLGPRGKDLKSGGIDTVIVNGDWEHAVPQLQRAYPNVRFIAASGQGKQLSLFDAVGLSWAAFVDAGGTESRENFLRLEKDVRRFSLAASPEEALQKVVEHISTLPA